MTPLPVQARTLPHRLVFPLVHMPQCPQKACAQGGAKRYLVVAPPSLIATCFVPQDAAVSWWENRSVYVPHRLKRVALSRDLLTKEQVHTRAPSGHRLAGGPHRIAGDDMVADLHGRHALAHALHHAGGLMPQDAREEPLRVCSPGGTRFATAWVTCSVAVLCKPPRLPCPRASPPPCRQPGNQRRQKVPLEVCSPVSIASPKTQVNVGSILASCRQLMFIQIPRSLLAAHSGVLVMQV